VNLAQIRSVVPEIFHTQTKNHRLMAPKTEPSAVHCRSPRAVKTDYHRRAGESKRNQQCITWGGFVSEFKVMTEAVNRRSMFIRL